ncbi:MAG: MAPEG family protein [Legionella sp.]
MVTSLYAGILSLMFIALSVNVVNARRQFRVAMGDAQNIDVMRKIRAQGNFAEYSLFFLVLLGCAELNHLPHYMLHILGLIFIIGRAMHAYSLLKDEQYAEGKITAKPIWRIYGILCSFGCIGALGLIAIDQYFMSFF